MRKLAIIGGGAAGCFCAINVRRMSPDVEVHVYEAGKHPLAKVAVTGGGRCNLTNSFLHVDSLKSVYPRGDKLMKRAMSCFGNDDVMRWFETEGVRLVVQSDQCVFPQSQDAMEIVNTLLRLMRQSGVVLHLRCRPSVEKKEEGDKVTYLVDGTPYDYLVIAIGGCPRLSRLDFLTSLHLDVIPPVPSLFTFNVAGNWHQQLMGTVVEDASVMIAGTKFRSRGALLLTHWGMSGPAILRLSSHAARWLSDSDYKCTIVVNWCGERDEEEVRQLLSDYISSSGTKLVTNTYPRWLTQRHWLVLLDRSGIPHTQRWNAINRKQLNRLVSTLVADVHEVTGRCAFKEEFVTAGGIALSNVNISTLEAKHHPHLYFAGEVLDVDAVTGGFNLQAAWSMAYVVAKQIALLGEE